MTISNRDCMPKTIFLANLQEFGGIGTGNRCAVHFLSALFGNGSHGAVKVVQLSQTVFQACNPTCYRTSLKTTWHSHMLELIQYHAT